MFLGVVAWLQQLQSVSDLAVMNFVQRVRRKIFPPAEIIEGYEDPELVETIFLKTITHKPSGDWCLDKYLLGDPILS